LAAAGLFRVPTVAFRLCNNEIIADRDIDVKQATQTRNPPVNSLLKTSQNSVIMENERGELVDL